MSVNLNKKMLRSFGHLLKGQRVSSAVVNDEPPIPTGDIALECETLQTQSVSSVVNPEGSTLAPQGEERGQADDNIKLVEVDLSPVYDGGVGEDTCKVQLKVIGINQPDIRGPGGPSSSYSEDPSLVDKKGASIEISTDQQYPLQHQSITITVQMPPPRQNSVDSCKSLETAFTRTVSQMSTESMAEHCRICQLTTEEPLIELGCHCRGELAKTHRTCIQQWFNNKGTNKCEVCRHVATNLPAPISQPLQNFWTWRMNRSYRHGAVRRWRGRGQFHPLLAALLILVAGLMLDVLISYYLGASALPVNIIIGVLVVLGLGTAARLIMDCCHDRSVRRSIRRMEMAADMDHLHSISSS